MITNIKITGNIQPLYSDEDALTFCYISVALFHFCRKKKENILVITNPKLKEYRINSQLIELELNGPWYSLSHSHCVIMRN